MAKLNKSTLTAERMLHSQGFGSRRKCRLMIEAGMVSVAGRELDDPDEPLNTEGLAFAVEGKVWPYHERAYIMLNKPAGYECSNKPKHHPSVNMLLPPELVEREIQGVGRLDADTTGLLLMTDDGQFIHRLTSPKKGVGKIYQITTAEPVTQAQCDALLSGVKLHEEIPLISALAAKITGENTLEMMIAEGKYHQVKRMVAAAGNSVAGLHRSQIGGLVLPADLKEGEWRWLSAQELGQLVQTAGA